MTEQNYRCQCCDRKLNPDTMVFLDLNRDTLEYRREPWPEEVSQGGFPFGQRCAKRVLSKAETGTRYGK